MLDAPRLSEALENCRSVKALDLDFPSKGSTPNDFADLKHLAPAAYVFGFRGYKSQLNRTKTAILKWVRKAQIETILHLPEVIVTEGLAVIKNDYRYFDSNRVRRKCGYDPIFIAARDRNPLRWLLHHSTRTYQQRNRWSSAEPKRHQPLAA